MGASLRDRVLMLRTEPCCTVSGVIPNAARELVRQALRWAYWCAGEGLCAVDGEKGHDGQPIIAPDEFLVAYSEATGDEHWETFAERLP